MGQGPLFLLDGPGASGGTVAEEEPGGAEAEEDGPESEGAGVSAGLGEPLTGCAASSALGRGGPKMDSSGWPRDALTRAA